MTLKLSLKLFFDDLLNFTRLMADGVIVHSLLGLLQAVLASHNKIHYTNQKSDFSKTNQNAQ